MPKIPPPAYALTGLLVQHLLAPRPRRAGALRSVAGGALAVGSVGLLAAANRLFVLRHTTHNPFEPGQATSLVTDGVFGRTRNPMYVGMAGLLAAHAVARGGWLTPLPVAAFVAVIDRTQIPAEETALAGLFGSAYGDYRRSVPRWVGPLSPG